MPASLILLHDQRQGTLNPAFSSPSKEDKLSQKRIRLCFLFLNIAILQVRMPNAIRQIEELPPFSYLPVTN